MFLNLSEEDLSTPSQLSSSFVWHPKNLDVTNNQVRRRKPFSRLSHFVAWTTTVTKQIQTHIAVRGNV